MLLPQPRHLGTSGARPSGIWPATVVAWGRGDASKRHAHHAIHFVLARSGSLRVEAADGLRQEASGVYVPGDRPHAIDATGSEVAIVFVEPESERGAGIYRRLGRSLRCFDAEETGELLATFPSVGSEAHAIDSWLEAFFDALQIEAWRPLLHPGVERVLAWLRSAGPDEDTRLSNLALQAGLSPSRLSHVWKESTGLPLRQHLLWRRLLHAAALMQSGASLTQVAHAAGFADTAHLSRTFRRMFGDMPSAVRDRSRSVQAT